MKKIFHFSTLVVSLVLVLLMTSCSGILNYISSSENSSQAIENNSQIEESGSFNNALEYSYDISDVRWTVSYFLTDVKYQQPDQALSYTTKTEEMINCVNEAVDPDSVFNAQPWDEDTKYIMIDLLLPIMKSPGYFYSAYDPVITSETTAEVEVYVNNFSCGKAYNELIRRVNDLSDRDIKRYKKMYLSRYGIISEDIDPDKFNKYLLYAESEWIINYQSELSEPYTFKVNLEKIDDEWLITSFSNSNDFVDAFLWRLSKMND